MIQTPKERAENLRLRLHARLELRTVLHRPMVSALYGWAFLAAAMLPFSRSLRLHLQLIALRRFERGLGLTLAQRAVRRWLHPSRVSVWREYHIGWRRYYGDFGNIIREPNLKSSLLLKAPGPCGEKGVLYAAFEYNWMKILAGRDPRAFFRDYILVGASSGSPSDYAAFANLCGLSDDPIFIGISNHTDFQQYETFAPYISSVPIMACDLCDPDFFTPLPRNRRSIDVLMVAHFARLKRHWLLFEALKKMPRNLNIVLIGREHPKATQSQIRKEARAFGVTQDLTILTGLDIDQVAAHECDAKVSVILSKREGACVAVTESMFADTPVVMMHDAHVGSRAHINSRTGEIAKRRELHLVLSGMLENPSKYSPRAWACQNISARRSSELLNEVLRDCSLSAGRPWTQNIAPFCRRYVPRYLDEQDAVRLRPGVEQLRERHGIGLEEFISESDARRRHQEAMSQQA